MNRFLTGARRRQRWFLSAILLGVTLLGIGGVWIVREILPYAILCPGREERWRVYPNVTPSTLGMQADDLWLEAEPGLWLRGWFVRPGQPARGTVVVLHGSSSCKEAMLGLAKRFIALGFNSLVYDSRAHGESGGKYCTFGYYEKQDFSHFVDEIQRRYGADAVGPVAVFGNSLGAAVGLQAMAQDARVRCGVVESPFATFREIVRDYMRHYSGVPFSFIANAAVDSAERIARFAANKVQPEQAAERIRCPVLVAHGTQDHWIDSAYGQRVFRHLHHPGSRWYPIAGADHDNLWKTGRSAYEGAVLDFLVQHGR